MLTRIPGWRQIVAPAFFAILVIVVGIVILRAFGGTVPLQANGYRVTASVPEADAVLPNSSVRISGVDVGRVVDVESRGRSALVTMEIDSKYAPVRTGARIIVRSKTLLGEGYVEMAPGPVEAAAIPDDGTMRTAQVRKAQRLDDVLQTFDPATRKDIRGMIQGTATAFKGRASSLNDALGRSPRLISNLNEVLDDLDGQRAPLQQLVSQAADVTDALGSRDADIAGAVRQGSRLVAATAARDQKLSDTIDALPSFLSDLRGASGQLRLASGDINTAVASLRPTAPLLQPALASIRDDTGDLQTLFQHVPALLKDAKTALPPTQRILDATGPTLPTTHMAARQLLPFVQLAAADRKQFVANFSNVSSMMNGRYETAGGKVGQYASGMLSAWNEIIGGWTKKLPTNRSNPYPRPDQTDNINKGGIEAYDCRNLGNPSILPAFGGVPDCKTQGPWTFNGRSASYPRLLLPAP